LGSEVAACALVVSFTISASRRRCSGQRSVRLLTFSLQIHRCGIGEPRRLNAHVGDRQMNLGRCNPAATAKGLDALHITISRFIKFQKEISFVLARGYANSCGPSDVEARELDSALFPSFLMRRDRTR
jgi:hypothetical protein